MINLEIPRKLKAVADMAHEIGASLFRPISRKYDRAEHEYPVELDALRSILSGMEDGGATVGAGSIARAEASGEKKIRNGKNMATVLNVIELCWGDLGLMLTIPLGRR